MLLGPRAGDVVGVVDERARPQVDDTHGLPSCLLRRHRVDDARRLGSVQGDAVLPQHPARHGAVVVAGPFHLSGTVVDVEPPEPPRPGPSELRPGDVAALQVLRPADRGVGVAGVRCADRPVLAGIEFVVGDDPEVDGAVLVAVAEGEGADLVGADEGRAERSAGVVAERAEHRAQR